MFTPKHIYSRIQLNNYYKQKHPLPGFAPNLCSSPFYKAIKKKKKKRNLEFTTRRRALCMRRRKMVTSRVNIENEHTSILISLIPEAKKKKKHLVNNQALRMVSYPPPFKQVGRPAFVGSCPTVATLARGPNEHMVSIVNRDTLCVRVCVTMGNRLHASAEASRRKR